MRSGRYSWRPFSSPPSVGKFQGFPLVVHSCDLFAKGQMPGEVVQTIKLGRMTILQKDGGGVRGIVAGEVIRRQLPSDQDALQTVTELDPEKPQSSPSMHFTPFQEEPCCWGWTRWQWGDKHSRLCACAFQQKGGNTQHTTHNNNNTTPESGGKKTKIWNLAQVSASLAKLEIGLSRNWPKWNITRGHNSARESRQWAPL